MISVFNKFILGAFFIITFCACGNFLEEVSQDEFEPETTDAYSELLNGAGYAFAELDGLTWYMDDDIDGVSSYSYTVSIMLAGIFLLGNITCISL